MDDTINENSNGNTGDNLGPEGSGVSSDISPKIEEQVKVDKPAITGKKLGKKPRKPVVRNDKGQIVEGSLNPNGRPTGAVSITDGIKRLLLEVDPEDKKTNLDKILKVIMTKALSLGDEKMLKTIWNYMDGMPKATIGLDVDKENLSLLTDFFRASAKPNPAPAKKDTPAPEGTK